MGDMDLMPVFHRLFRRHAKRRLKAPERASSSRVRAFLGKPMMRRLCWFLMWAVSVLLAATAKERDINLKIGRVSPFTIVSPVAFSFFSGTAEGGEPARIHVPEGSVLIERGVTVTEETSAAVRAYGKRSRAARPLFGRLGGILGDGVILLAALMICASMLRVFKLESAKRNSYLFLFFTISMLTIIPSRWYYVLDELSLPAPPGSLDFLLPLSLSTLLASILLGPLWAVVMGFWVSATVAVLSGYSLAVFMMGFASAVVIARMTRFVRSRAAVLRLGMYGGLASAVCAAGFSMAASLQWQYAGFGVAFCLISGIVSALIALLLLPFFEVLFGITTDISLLELSDLEHPLLKRLAIEAPGTYHHSLMVANLAQAAVAAIGGNTLRVSICSYFHDIGKLVKPTFFSENTRLSDNPHDDLSPSMSTLVVISHVKEGVSLALRHKLPRLVLDGIRQHHGTGLVYYFYHKAKEGAQSDGAATSKAAIADVNEKDFRYPGPKPRSPETAILCLADSIEAGSRSLEKISTSHIERLVNDVIADKSNDGQLDECSLTLAEIGKIKKAFIFTLTNMLHSRISYPINEHRSKQQTIVGAGSHDSDSETGSHADG